jgi:hypothetical protein
MRVRARPYWVWSDGKWRSRFRTREQAEAEAELLPRMTGGPSFVIEVGLLRYKFLSGFPKDQEAGLRELFGEYHGKLSFWNQMDMPWPPL